MESSGVLNAGCGAYLTEDGTVELDAMIMDGQTLNTGELNKLLLLQMLQIIYIITEWLNSLLHS